MELKNEDHVNGHSNCLARLLGVAFELQTMSAPLGEIMVLRVQGFRVLGFGVYGLLGVGFRAR